MTGEGSSGADMVKKGEGGGSGGWEGRREKIGGLGGGLMDQSGESGFDPTFFLGETEIGRI